MTFVSELEPQELWRHFDEILTIPRGSKEEEQIRQYLVAVAERNGLSYQQDGTGNLVVRKPAAAGREGAPVTILQSHLDMVNEKNSDVEHDFSQDPIRPQQDGDYLKASGTTLGSDNGIGVAAMLALMESTETDHGPLELLFTIDEETGLTGAASLDASMLQGRTLINLDSEEESSLCVGCAGGADSNLTLRLGSAETPAGTVGLTVRLHGLKGGHSGIDIHLQRANAVKLLARMLFAASLEHSFHLATFEGGNKHNAIPREATATLAVAEGVKESLAELLGGAFAEIEAEFHPAEPEMKLELSSADPPSTVWDDATGRAVLELVNGLPHGVLSMSYDIPGLVETSTNLATVKAHNGSLEIGLSSRSSVASALVALRQRIRATASLAGAAVEEGNGYPGWKPDLDSRVLAVVKHVHQRELGADPEVEAIHAGLECGLIGEMIPGMDMISFGPQIENPHSPDERVKIDSVDRFYRLLTATLKELAA